MTKPVETTIAAGSAVGEGEGATAVKVVSSLSKKMAEPGGLTVADIERRAKERLQKHKTDAMRSVELAVSELEKRVEVGADHPDEAFYLTASQMLDVAGFFDTGPLYDAGYSLCELLDVMQTSGEWNGDSVRVHVRALRMILNAGCETTPQSATLLAGLKALLDHARKD
ncbi:MULTISPECIES: chemotaxis protein CheE [unclassified Brevundimonas]|uniref:chemotaxis protein CheE n=1 Tax=unclassified Brevundimonas TaxID=2622653 RepID=UPI0025BF35E0|nr:MULTISPECIES: chemotaxis protein CheE [unclassified Brevundimonas]